MSPTGRGIPAGARVLLTRAPDRARPLVDLLAAAGAHCLVSPLRQARRPDVGEAAAALAVLRDGTWDAAVLTSANGARGLALLAESAGLAAADLLGPAQVHCVGRATARAARRIGLRPAPAAEEQSAAGLLSAFDERRCLAPGSRVVCVQGEPHRPEPAAGLRARGHRVGEAVVYAMADWPAENPLVPTDAAAAGAPVLDRAETARLLAEGGPDAVVATSPELLRTLCGLGPVRAPVVCIGRTTGGTAVDLGLDAVLAAGPEPQDLADAVTEAFATRRNA